MDFGLIDVLSRSILDEDDTKYDKANPNIRNKGPNHAWNEYKET